MNKKIMIIGGSSWIGSKVILRLAKDSEWDILASEMAPQNWTSDLVQ